MPIYEFYCAKCHTIYNFRTGGFDSDRSPKCPDCGGTKLEKQISMFAISKGRGESAEGDDGFPDLDESALEKAMLSLESEAGGLDEDDPRAMAKFMRKLYDSTGMKLGSGIDEAIRRMEAGEDPDKIEEDMGDALEAEEVLFGGSSSDGKRISLTEIRKRITPPRKDPTLYELDD